MRLQTVYTAPIAALLMTTPVAAQPRRPSPDVLARAVDSLSARIVAAGVTPALGVAVVMDGKTVLARSYGFADVTRRIPADDRTLWYVASTSKSYTGFAVSLLAHQGVLRFDQSIASLLPRAEWYQGVDPTRLTLAQFLSHTHYLNDNAVVMSAAFTGEIPEARWPRLIRYAAPMSSPDLVYSNFGYNVAAMVIDAKRPEGWRRYLDSAIYKPVGMNETYTRVSGLDERRIAKPHRRNADDSFSTSPFYKIDATMNSAGGHVATLHDLARWTIVQMDGGVIDGKRVFPAAAVELSHRMIARHTVESSRHFGPFEREGWAAGWDIGSYEGEPMVSRFGGYMTIRSELSMLPRRRIGVVAQVTGAGGASAADIVSSFAYDLEAGRENARQRATARLDSLIARRPAQLRQLAAADSASRARQALLKRPLSDFAGSYVNEAFGTIQLTLSSNALAFKWGAVYSPVEVADATRNQLSVDVAGSRGVITFALGESGPARSITLQGETFTRK